MSWNFSKFLSICHVSGFLLGIFSGGGAKSIVMQISFVLLLFSNQISGRGKGFQGANCLRGRPPVEESQCMTRDTEATNFPDLHNFEQKN